ncbi:MAG: hypothetical protein ACPG49_07045 [Chitinophagales bacterium]
MNDLLIFILILLSIASCTEKKDTAYVPEEFKIYTVFNEGTWWIYEEVLSGEKDSSFVFSSKTRILNHRSLSYKQEMIEQQTVRKKDTIYQLTYPSDKLIEGLYLYTYKEENRRNFSFPMTLLPYPIDSIGQQVPFQGGAVITAIEEKIIIQNQTYLNTISVSFDRAVAENGNPPWKIRSCTFAQNIGMIRIQYYDGTIWELVDYKII